MKRSSISVRYDKFGLRVKAPGDLTDIELDEALDALIERSQSQESSRLKQLELISSALNKISMSSVKHCSVLNNDITKRSEELKDAIREYFQSDSSLKDLDISSQVCSSIIKFRISDTKTIEIGEIFTFLSFYRTK